VAPWIPGPTTATGIANGVNSISRSTGSAIGSAVITSLLASKTLDKLSPGALRCPPRASTP